MKEFFTAKAQRNAKECEKGKYPGWIRPLVVDNALEIIQSDKRPHFFFAFLCVFAVNTG
jgi:hypothetical protein